VTLTGTAPDPGFAVTVKHAGPEEIEVAFVDGRLECQIHAHPGNGKLLVEVENPDE
jgi:hypothetical protein